MVDNLKEKAAEGILWKFLDQGGTQVIQFISGIYIARILSPEDYGLIGMMAIFLAISQVFIDGGFKATLIQKGESVTQEEYNVVFYFNIFISIFFYLLIFWGAKPIANFYNEPKLVNVAKVLGLNLILISFGAIHQVTFEKRLNFRTITKIKLTAVLLSVVSGILLANNGFGVWALISMVLLENFIRTVLFWIINKWRPNLCFKTKVFKNLFSNGFKILLGGIIGQINQNIFSLIIGKYFATTDVGFYSQGRKLQQRVGDFISFSIQGVMFPIQSLIKDDIPRLKASVRKNVNIASLVAFPALVGLITVAKSFIVLFLTEKWLESVFYLQIVSFAGIIFIVNQALKSFLIPLGKFNFSLIYVLISNITLLFLITLCILLNAGIKWIVIIKVIHEFLLLIANVIVSKKFIKYNLREILYDLFKPSIFSLIMGGIVYFVYKLGGINFYIFALQIFLGVSIYILLNLLFNYEFFNEIRLLLKQRKST